MKSRSIQQSIKLLFTGDLYILEIMCKEKNLSPLSLSEENTEACIKLFC